MLRRYWGERATKVEMLQLEGWRSGGGEHVGGGGDIRVRELVARLNTRHDDRTRHLKQVLERIGDTVLHGVNKLFNKGTSQPPGFGGLGMVPLGEGGVLPLPLHRFHIEHWVKVLRNLVPPRQIFSTFPQVVLQSSARRISRWTV